MIDLVVNVINKEFAKENKKQKELSVLRNSTNSNHIISFKKAFANKKTNKEEKNTIKPLCI